MVARVGSAAPAPPTDPDVRISRIRLFESGLRWELKGRVHDPRRGEWVSRPEGREGRPRHPGPVRAPTQPLPPNVLHLVEEAGQRAHVAGDAVVRVVAE